MKGYFKNPEATANALDSEGWIYTGDVGHYNADGYVKVIDRTKELIKVNANQVSAQSNIRAEAYFL